MRTGGVGNCVHAWTIRCLLALVILGLVDTPWGSLEHTDSSSFAGFFWFTGEQPFCSVELPDDVQLPEFFMLSTDSRPDFRHYVQARHPLSADNPASTI